MTRIIIETDGRIVIETSQHVNIREPEPAPEFEPSIYEATTPRDPALDTKPGDPPMKIIYDDKVYNKCPYCRGMGHDISKYDGDIFLLGGEALYRVLAALPECEHCVTQPGRDGFAVVPSPPTEEAERLGKMQDYTNETARMVREALNNGATRQQVEAIVAQRSK